MNLNEYSKFVESVTSDESNKMDALRPRLETLNQQDFNPSLLLTAVLGLSAESGEFVEIVKKIFFQGKEFNEANRFHMKRELGDVAWYWVNACRALNLDPNDVIEENVKKLEDRYPGGEFDTWFSENRTDGDL
jgi:NTP pyrophosphatase (non-canonical NTP hydrolase)